MNKITSLVKAKEDLGHVFQFELKNCHNLTLKAFSWQVGTPKAIVLLLHGLGTNVLYDFLCMKYPENVSKSTPTDELIQKTYLTYEGSIIQKFNIRKISVFAYDQQGHGASQSWDDQPCNVDSFNDLVYDSLQFALRVHESFNKQFNVPIYLCGISMGGAVQLRVAELYKYILRSRTMPHFKAFEALTELSTEDLPQHLTETFKLIYPEAASAAEVTTRCQELPLKGVISLCPAVGIGSVKKSPLIRMLLPFSKIASEKIPSWKIVSLKSNPMFPWTEKPKYKEGSLVYTERLPNRIAHEVKTAGRLIQKDSALLADEAGDRTLQYLFVHSETDELCDFEATKLLVNNLKQTAKDVELFIPQNMWHYLLTEPGSNEVTNQIIAWLMDRVA